MAWFMVLRKLSGSRGAEWNRDRWVRGGVGTEPEPFLTVRNGTSKGDRRNSQ